MSADRIARPYRDASGARYFAWQEPVGIAAATLDRAKFEPYLQRGDAVLDFGCGGGELLATLEASAKIGIEVNESARTAARSRGLDVRESLDAVGPASVDVVISNHALEHTLQPFRELQALRNVLKPGGRLVLWVPLDDWRTHPRRVEGIGGGQNHHLYTWTPLLLSNLLVEAGLEVVECRVVTSAWPPGYAWLAPRLPKPLFEAVAALTGFLLRRRQVLAVATRRDV